MSAFLTPLQLELLTCPFNIPLKNRDGRQLYRLIEQFICESDIAKKTIIVPVGFITDLASIPRIPIVYRELEQLADMPGVPHDFCYSTGFLDRDTADLMLKELCLLIGLSRWKAQAIYWGVRIGGKSHYMQK